MLYSINRLAVIFYVILFLFSTSTFAGDDPKIKGELRKNIKNSMNEFVEENTVKDKLHLFDAVDGKMLDLKFASLHEGIVKKGDYYVSCADFVDQSGRKIDVDFLVIPDGKELKTVQAIVHSIDGKKRKYHLENK